MELDSTLVKISLQELTDDIALCLTWHTCRAVNGKVINLT